MKTPDDIVHKLQNRFRKIPVSLADELIQERRQEAAFADRACLATGIERHTLAAREQQQPTE
jgi:hypothetical protein